MSDWCALGEACEGFASGRPAHIAGFNLCETCLTRCRGEVQALVLDFMDLSQVIGRRQQPSDTRISRPKPQSVPPIDLNVDELRSAIMWTLLGAEYVLRGLLRLPARRVYDVREGYNVWRSAALVAPRVDTLAGVQELPHWMRDAQVASGADLLMLLRSHHQRARRMCGHAELTIALPGFCESCKAPALARRDGSETVKCRSCAWEQTWRQYQKRVTLTVEPEPDGTDQEITGTPA